MLISCDTCSVRGAACQGCMVKALFEAVEESPAATTAVPHEAAEYEAIKALTRAGFDVTVLDDVAVLEDVTVLEDPRDQGTMRGRRVSHWRPARRQTIAKTA